jgi:hypothetical protein
MRLIISFSAVTPSRTSNPARVWARNASASDGIRGSGSTVTVCVCVSPLTVTAILYVPGTTSGPRLGSKNSLGGASFAEATLFGPSYRMFQTCRLMPSFAGAQSVVT